MPYQCVRCSRIIPATSQELLKGCNKCGGKLFFYIREEKLKELQEKPIKIPKNERPKVERDIREIAGIEDPDAPVILDIESVRVLGAGKFEIDLVSLFKKDRPIIYKVEDGKYIIDFSPMLKSGE